MKYRTRLAVGTVVASLALPASAAAHDHPSLKSVRAHASAARQALARVDTLVRANRDRAADRYLARYLRQLRKADREAARLRRRARSARGARQAVRAELSVGVVADSGADMLPGLVDEAGVPVQLDIAKAISSSIAIREHVAELLAGLMEVVPEEVRPAVARAIALLSSGGLDNVANIGEVLQTPGLPPEVAEAVKEALELATKAIDDAVDRLNGIVELVPPEARPYVEQAVNLVSAQLEQVKTLLGQLLGDLLGGQLPSLPTGLLPGFLQGLPFDLPIDLPFPLPGFGGAVR